MNAQLPTLPSNLTNVKSADISEEQLTQIKGYLGKNNLSTQQAYELLLARGMNQVEATTLKGRLDAVNTSGTDNNNNKESSKSAVEDNTRSGERRLSDTANKTVQVSNPKKIFGLEIFNNGVLSFEPGPINCLPS